LGDKVLGIVGAVEVFPGAVLSRAGVVSSDDEVGATKVLPDDRVPQGLPRTGHAHAQGKKGQEDRTFRIVGENLLVAPDAGEIVHVSWLREPDDGMDQKMTLDRVRRSVGQLDMGPVHGVPGLESDDPFVPHLGEGAPELPGGGPEMEEVVVLGEGEPRHLAPDIEGMGLVEEEANSGMGFVQGSEDGLGLRFPVGLPDFGNRQNGDWKALNVVESDGFAGEKRVGKGFLHVEDDRHGPEVPGLKSDLRKGPLVVCSPHES